MRRARTVALFAAVGSAAVGSAAAAAGAAYHFWSHGAETGRSADLRATAGRVLTARLADLQGGAGSLERWRGRVLVVNFWATWCAPCREEVPAFVRLQERYGGRGLQFVGIALDQPEPVGAFAREFRINYPLLLGGSQTMELLRQAGNRAGVLPYTLVIDRKGNVISREPGGLEEARLESLIQPLL